MNDVEIFRFDNNNNFINKIIANTASLKENMLILQTGKDFNSKKSHKSFEKLSIQLSNKFDSFNQTSEIPENMNIVELYDNIQLKKKLGVTTQIT